jgi:hypothetical protein
VEIQHYASVLLVNISPYLADSSWIAHNSIPRLIHLFDTSAEVHHAILTAIHIIVSSSSQSRQVAFRSIPRLFYFFTSPGAKTRQWAASVLSTVINKRVAGPTAFEGKALQSIYPLLLSASDVVASQILDAVKSVADAADVGYGNLLASGIISMIIPLLTPPREVLFAKIVRVIHETALSPAMISGPSHQEAVLFLNLLIEAAPSDDLRVQAAMAIGGIVNSSSSGAQIVVENGSVDILLARLLSFPNNSRDRLLRVIRGIVETSDLGKSSLKLAISQLFTRLLSVDKVDGHIGTLVLIGDIAGLSPRASGAVIEANSVRHLFAAFLHGPRKIRKQAIVTLNVVGASSDVGREVIEAEVVHLVSRVSSTNDDADLISLMKMIAAIAKGSMGVLHSTVATLGIPPLVILLCSPSETVQIWALATILWMARLSAQAVAATVTSRAIPTIVSLLENPRAQWLTTAALETIARSSRTNADLVVQSRAVPSLVAQLASTSGSLQEYTVAALGAIARSSPKGNEEIIAANALAPLTSLLDSTSEKMQEQAIAILGVFVNASSKAVPILVNANTLPRLVSKLSSESPAMQKHAASTLGVIARASEYVADADISADAIPSLVHLLSSGADTILEEAIATLEDIIKSSPRGSLVAINSQLIPLLASLSLSAEENIQMLTIAVIGTIAESSPDAAKALVDAKVVPPLFTILLSHPPDLLRARLIKPSA